MRPVHWNIQAERRHEVVDDIAGDKEFGLERPDDNPVRRGHGIRIDHLGITKIPHISGFIEERQNILEIPMVTDVLIVSRYDRTVLAPEVGHHHH